MSAMKAGMTRKTAGKYLRQDNVMEQRQVEHTWRTRKDALQEIWPRAVEMLEVAPELEAKTLFEHLIGHLMPVDAGHTCAVEEKQLLTLQRRVWDWRLAHGSEKEVFSRSV